MEDVICWVDPNKRLPAHNAPLIGKFKSKNPEIDTYIMDCFYCHERKKFLRNIRCLDNGQKTIELDGDDYPILWASGFVTFCN